MNYKVAIINVYFGKLPKWFNLWLRSCEYNKKFTWILFTDDETEFNYPKNVIRNLCDFNEIKNLIIEKLNLDVNVNDPYKLCDFKTLYGKIFSDFLGGFTHWGYCDLDMIFGDLSKFITDEVLDNYERILNKGHLTIYKNNDRVNNYYKLPYSGPSYKEIFESKYHFGFDEVAGLDKLYKENNLSQYIPIRPIIADINFSNYRFLVNGHENYEQQYFYWEYGRVLRKYILNNEENMDEFAYIHFQKRKINIEQIDEDKFTISPKGICRYTNDGEMYKLNENIFTEQVKRKYKYFKVILKQKVFRFLHWKLKM